MFTGRVRDFRVLNTNVIGSEFWGDSVVIQWLLSLVRQEKSHEILPPSG